MLKVYYKKKIAALSVKPDCTVEKLKKMVQLEFNRKLQLHYEDADGDQLPIKKDKDLKTALRTVKPPIRSVIHSFLPLRSPPSVCLSFVHSLVAEAKQTRRPRTTARRRSWGCPLTATQRME